MPANILDGAAAAERIRAQVAEEVARRTAQGQPAPGLATVLVGENPASQVYVKSKHKACQQVGIHSFAHELPASASQQEVEDLVRELNADPQVNGILVQLPLPSGLDEERVLSAGQHREGRGWLPPAQHRPPGAERPRAALRALHPGGHACC